MREHAGKNPRPSGLAKQGLVSVFAALHSFGMLLPPSLGLNLLATRLDRDMCLGGSLAGSGIRGGTL